MDSYIFLFYIILFIGNTLFIFSGFPLILGGVDILYNKSIPINYFYPMDN